MRVGAIIRTGLVFAVIAASQGALGAVIHFNGETTNSSGTGFGSVLPVLVLKDKSPADGLEAGSVIWDGKQDVFGTVGGGVDTKIQQSATQTVSALALSSKSITADNLG